MSCQTPIGPDKTVICGHSFALHGSDESGIDEPEPCMRCGCQDYTPPEKAVPLDYGEEFRAGVYVPPQQLTPGGPVHGGWTYIDTTEQTQPERRGAGVFQESPHAGKETEPGEVVASGHDQAPLRTSDLAFSHGRPELDHPANAHLKEALRAEQLGGNEPLPCDKRNRGEPASGSEPESAASYAERKAVQKWADSAMFTAEPIDADEGPKVRLLWTTPDPLGAIAAAALGYKGRFVHDLSEVTDEERREMFEQVQKTHLKAPFEFVQFHFLIEGVTRGFTHQMVRQRTATYVQESTRFAVKEDMPVGLPPSLAGTTGNDVLEVHAWYEAEKAKRGLVTADGEMFSGSLHDEFEERLARVSQAERWRAKWEEANDAIRNAYLSAVDDGMPAEDARGLLPTNLLTKIQYRTDLRSLLEHGGNRLCTQAQFEWRLVFTRIVETIREYNPHAALIHQVSNLGDDQGAASVVYCATSDAWQYEALADMFRPICYLTGKCEFKANFDRKCSIRDRVDANASIGRPSSEWAKEFVAKRQPNPVHDPDNPMNSWPWAKRTDEDNPFGPKLLPMIPAIRPEEWLLNPGAAR